jgi:N-methylhydantoinase B/oxoprolinase/acetone carboxylase alpha subunit
MTAAMLVLEPIFEVNGKNASEARKMVMKPDDEVTLETPGGGYGAPNS